MRILDDLAEEVMALDGATVRRSLDQTDGQGVMHCDARSQY
jgi:hypothetical protein